MLHITILVHALLLELFLSGGQASATPVVYENSIHLIKTICEVNYKVALHGGFIFSKMAYTLLEKRSIILL